MIERKQQRGYGGCLLFLMLLLLAGFLIWRWYHFDRWRTRLPAGMTLAGVPVGRATREEAIQRWLGAYDGQITLHYQDQEIALLSQGVAYQPDVNATVASIEYAVTGTAASVTLQIDVGAAVASLDAELAKNSGIGGYFRYLLRQYPDSLDIVVEPGYSPQALREFLDNVARDYDQPAKPPVPQPSTGTYLPGEPGYHLDVEASMPIVVDALQSTSQREATLVVNVQEPPPPDFALLSQVIENELAAFPGIASVFAKDLQTGAEITINADVAYAGMSIIKIAIMAEAYRYLDQSPDADTTKILTETMTLSGNFTANLLLRMIGEGDAYHGTQVLNASMRRLGLINTFMATPYDEDVIPPTIITEANSRTDLNTEPDPYMQTTPADMGLLLEMIYQCSQGGGTLSFIYPDDFTASECQMMIDHMLANQLSGEEGVPVLIAAGLPNGTSLAHKHGWVADTRADAAIVFTSGGDYVLVIYLYQPGWVDWDIANSLMTRLSQLIYTFFNRPSAS